MEKGRSGLLRSSKKTLDHRAQQLGAQCHNQRSQPQPKPRIRCPMDCATQEPPYRSFISAFKKKGKGQSAPSCTCCFRFWSFSLKITFMSKWHILGGHILLSNILCLVDISCLYTFWAKISSFLRHFGLHFSAHTSSVSASLPVLTLLFPFNCSESHFLWMFKPCSVDHHHKLVL